MQMIRLQRFLAQSGVASRRKSETYITEGRVKVNGKTVKVLGTKVDPDRDRVTVDGQPIHQEDLFYAVFNKPKGCITAVSDPEGRRTIMEFLPGLPASVVPVGRLDFYSEGVLLLTNDGALSAALTASRKNVEKIYHIKIKGNVTDREIQKLRDGVRLDERTTTRPALVERLKARSSHDWLSVTITEGKNRQLHRMLEAIGHEITKLQRVSFAGLSFHGLRVGDARELSQNEMKELYEVAGVDLIKGLVSRGKWAVKRETTEKARRSADRGRERVTPNLTPGGSKRAKAKLLDRYREQEEDGTAPALPVPRVAPSRDSVHRPAKSKLVVGARPKPVRGEGRGGRNAADGYARPRPQTRNVRPGDKPDASDSERNSRPGGRRGSTTKSSIRRSGKSRPASKRGIAAGGRKPSSRRNATSKASRIKKR